MLNFERKNFLNLNVLFSIFFFLCLFFFEASCSSIIDPMKHDIVEYTQRTFDSKVAKFRKNFVYVIYAFRHNKQADKFILGELNDLATDLKGMITVGVINCDLWESYCVQSHVKEVPALILYPTLPFPPFTHTGELNKDSIKKSALNLIPTFNVKSLTSENIDTFLSENPALPKVILFSEKSKAPSLFSALANTFDNKLSFGFVNSKDVEKTSSITQKYNVKTYPHIILFKNDKKPEVYKNKSITFRDIHDWLNIFAETFVTGGGYSDSPYSSNNKPWVGLNVPKLNKASHQDICFKKGKGLCVIYLKNGEALQSFELRMLEELQQDFTSKVSDRGINFRWMWMDLNVEINFAKLFNVQIFPSLIVFNPFKRLRYTQIEGNATPEAIESLLDKIAGGDARFTNVPEQKLPEFADEEESPKKKTRDEL